MYNKKTMRDMAFEGKTVLVRCDFNVPLDEAGAVSDDKRITAALPTIRHLMEQKAKVVLLSHLGRPKGKVVPEYSLAPVAEKLSELLGREVRFIASEQVVDEAVRREVQAAPADAVILLENTRFRAEEKANDPAFSRQLAELGSAFVNDAFGTAHRAHSSNVGIAGLLPSCVGLLVEKELEIMGRAMARAERPFTAILGGSKVSDKIGVIRNLAETVDSILIGGGMMFTFMKALGQEIGASLVEDDQLGTAKELMALCKERGVDFRLPVDVVVADAFKNEAARKTVPAQELPAGWMGLDIGPETADAFSSVIQRSKTVLWNGPMGVFEFEHFAHGTRQVAEALAECDGTTIIGGGDSAAAIRKFGLEAAMTHISTGGGASLKLFEGASLPGIDCISDRKGE